MIETSRRCPSCVMVKKGCHASHLVHPVMGPDMPYGRQYLEARVSDGERHERARRRYAWRHPPQRAARPRRAAAEVVASSSDDAPSTEAHVTAPVAPLEVAPPPDAMDTAADPEPMAALDPVPEPMPEPMAEPEAGPSSRRVRDRADCLMLC